MTLCPAGVKHISKTFIFSNSVFMTEMDGEDQIKSLKTRFNGMKQRCYNPNSTGYKNYGKRGIVVCEEWLKDFDKFVSWALKNGFKQDFIIDRIDNDGPYSPTNCRWTTWKEQANNRRQRGLSAQQKRILLMLEFTQRKDDPKDGWFSTQEIISDLHPEYFLWLNSWRNEPFSRGPWDSTRLRRHESKRISVSRALRSLEKRGLILSYMRSGHNRFWAVPKRINKEHELNWVETPEERELRRKIWSWAWYQRRLDTMTRIHLRFGLLDEIPKEELEKIHQDYKDFWK